MCLASAFSANGKDVIVDFPQQSHWTGLLSEMELVPSVHPGVRYTPHPGSPYMAERLGNRATNQKVASSIPGRAK